MDNQDLILLVGKMNGKIESLVDGVVVLAEKVDKLPCGAHGERMEDIEDWQKCHNGVKKEESRSRISLKNGLIIGVSCAGLSGIITATSMLIGG